MSDFALDDAEFLEVGARIVSMAARHLQTRRSEPVFRPMTPEQRARVLRQPLPDEPLAPAALLDFFADAIEPHAMGNGSPRFFGWVNSPPAQLAVAGEILAAAMNPSCAGGDHAAIYLEHCVTRWLRELTGFPVEGSAGILVSGGSMATLTGLAAARHCALERIGVDVRADGLQSIRTPLTVYATDQGHSCIRKGLELLGLGANSIRTVATDRDWRMSPLSLRELVRRDRDEGKLPFCVAASAGTVNSGAIDPLEEIHGVCEEEELWLHVDGAYGAVGILDPAIRHLYRGMETADSVALDPHKWLSVPVECGCVLVRDAGLLREAFSLVPPYLRTEPDRGFGGLPWFSEYGFQQTRGFRALKLWLTIAAAGRRGLSERIVRNNQLAARLREKIEADPEFELTAAGPLSIVCFRYRPDDGTLSDGEVDALNKAIMETLQAGGECFVTNTVLGRRFSLRACVLHYDTKEADLDALLGAVKAAASQARERVTHDGVAN